MKRILVVLMVVWGFLGIVLSDSYGAEERKQTKKAKPLQETKSPETSYHALIIGNNQYNHLPRLKTARNDAVEVERLLREKFQFQTEILLDATRTNILNHINELRKKLGEKDNLLIYYAGHGENDKTVDKSYWLPIDAQRDNPTNWIMADDITSNIKRIAARHVLVVSDSCYSGTLGRQAVTELISTGGREGYLKKMQDRPSRTLMASGGNEPVSDSGGGNNSVFAAAFIKSLQESDRTQFTAEEIFHTRIKAIVAGKSDQVPEYSSIRNSGDEGGDFVFRLARIEVEPANPVSAKKVQDREEEKLYEKEQMKQQEVEPRLLEAEKTQLEKELKRVELEQKLEEERQRLEAEKKLLEEERKTLADQKAKKPVLTTMASRPSQAPSSPSSYIEPITGMEFVLIPAGRFFMGSPADEMGRFENEGPQHQVEITKPFFLGKYEVTVGQFRKFVQETGYKTDAETGGGAYTWTDRKWEKKEEIYWDNLGFSQTDRHPVTCVSWEDAYAFIKWLNRKTGASYRLPTEAEWEYAARAGTTTARFWGDDPKDACSYANVADQTKSPDRKYDWKEKHECNDGYWFPAPVGSYRPNALELYDMLGNVWEWCEDWFDKNYYKNSPILNPTGPSTGVGRVIRGGGWSLQPKYVRAATRGSNSPDDRNADLGFRLAGQK